MKPALTPTDPDILIAEYLAAYADLHRTTVLPTVAFGKDGHYRITMPEATTAGPPLMAISLVSATGRLRQRAKAAGLPSSTQPKGAHQ